jgi:hypothetical protein
MIGSVRQVTGVVAVPCRLIRKFEQAYHVTTHAVPKRAVGTDVCSFDTVTLEKYNVRG